MNNKSTNPARKNALRTCRSCLSLMFMLFVSVPLAGMGQTLNIAGGSQSYVSLTNTTINLSGKCELHLTATNNMMTTITPMDAMSGCVVNLNSPDAWLYLDGTRPYRVNLAQFYINGAPAVNGVNVRLTEYGMGAVVIPQSPGYQPLMVYSGGQFTGSSNQLSLYTYYNGTNSINGELNNVAIPFNGAIGSFTLKHGYAATFAKNADGSGPSRVYIAAVDDVQLGVLPPGLSGGVGFIRCYPWNWKPKKGWAGGDGGDALMVDTPWNYDWGSGAPSVPSCEYAPMQWGNGYSWSINNKQGSTLLLGFNEPDSTSQANMTTAAAVNDWTNLLNSGLRVGSPACTDGGWSSWLFPFINAADAAGVRVDTVEQHMYMCGQTASSLQSWMWNIHVNTGRRVGLTEFNNGANWTTCAQPTPDQEAATIQAFIQMMDTQNFVEGYNIYEWVQNSRMMVLNGVLTPAGTNYLNEWSPIAYLQELSGNPKWYLAVNGGVGRTNATYDFNGNVLDSSGDGNNAMLAGTHTFAGSTGNQVLQLDGAHDYVVLPPNVGKAANFTFAGWINWSGGSAWQRIFDFGLDNNQYLFLTPSSGSGTLRFAITTSGGGGEQQLTAPALTPGVWTHVAVTINGSTAKLFTNGVLAASSTTLSINPASIPLVYCWLGKSQYFPDPLFKGALADVVIEGFALTDAQIASLATTPPTVGISMAAAPTGLTTTAVSSSQVNLSWTGSTGANTYNVKRATTSGGPYTIIAQGITSASYSDTLGNAGTTYYYVVSAVNGSGESANSAQASATTATGVPGAPTGLTAHAGTWQVSLTWVASQSPGANSYNIKRSTTSGGPYTTIASGVSAPAAGSYIDQNSNPGTYYYVVSGVNAYGESANSAEVSATLRDIYTYWKFDETNGTTAYDSIGANNGTLGSGCNWVTGKTNGAVQLDGTTNAYVSVPAGLLSPLTDFSVATWVNLGASNAWQRIFDFGSGTGTYMFLTPEAGSGGPLRFAITAGSGEQRINGAAPLTAGVWHHIAVTLANTVGVLYLDGVPVGTNTAMTLEPMNLGNTTQNTIGQSQFSADPHLTGIVDDFRIYGRALSASEVAALVSGAPAPPVAPTGLGAIGGNLVVNLNWIQSTSSGITGNNVYRSTTGSGGPYNLLAQLAATTSYSDTVVNAGNTYFYSVTAVNTNGESALSAYAGATTIPPAPTGLSAAAGNNRAALSWSASTGASSYNVKRATGSGGPYTTIASGLTTTGYTDTTVTNGTTYYYVVSAVNSSGESANSAQVSATPSGGVVPYSVDANTLVLFHFDQAGGSVTTNIGSLAKRAYSVNLSTASTTPPLVTNVLGAAAYTNFGNAATFASGQLIGWDANNNGAYNGDNGTTLSADAITMTNLNMGNGGQTPWTLEALIYVTATNANQEIIATDSSGTTRGFQFRISATGKLELNLIATGPDILTPIPTTGVNAYVANNWYHVAATYDGTNVRLYWTRLSASVTSANLISTTAASVGTAFGAASGPVCVGGENRAANGEYFHGRIDEVRISNVARAASGGFYW